LQKWSTLLLGPLAPTQDKVGKAEVDIPARTTVEELRRRNALGPSGITQRQDDTAEERALGRTENVG